MEGDGLGLYFTLLHVDFVTGKNNGNVLADTNKIACLKPLDLVSYK